MNQIATTMVILLFSASTSLAETQDALSQEAISFAQSTLGVANGIQCTDGKKTWTQWKVMPKQNTSQNFKSGFVQPQNPEMYLEAIGVDEGKVSIFDLKPADIANEIEFTGIVKWSAELKRQFSTATGLEIWSTENPIFQLRVQKVSGQWIISDAIPNWIASAPPTCVDVQQLAQNIINEKKARDDALIINDRRKYEENLRKYPVQPHTSDPYYQKN